MSLTNTSTQNTKLGDKAIKLHDKRGPYMKLSPNGGKWWRFKFG